MKLAPRNRSLLAIASAQLRINRIEETTDVTGSAVAGLRVQNELQILDRLGNPLHRAWQYCTRSIRVPASAQFLGNLERFPEDFMFQLTPAESDLALRSQIVISNVEMKALEIGRAHV